jgi:hypothetical protein
MSVDGAIKEIGKRRWDILSERWRGYIPFELSDLPQGYQPLLNDELFIESMRAIEDVGSFQQIEDIPKFRTLSFEAARFSMERCLYFSRVAESLIIHGTPTAALSCAYLAMWYGTRSIQIFLGVNYCFSGSRTWMIDFWPEASEVSSGGRQKEWVAKINGLVSNQRIGHEHHWKLFIRLRAVSTRLPIDDEGAAIIFRRLKSDENFSSRRNQIQYHDKWPYADMYDKVISGEIGILPKNFDFNIDDVDCDVKIAQLVAFCAAKMILEILAPLNKFREYSAKLKSRLTNDDHPILSAGGLSEQLRILSKYAE